MPLTYHYDCVAAANFSGDSKDVTETKLNDNFDVMETNDQGVEDRSEDTWYDAKGSGILAGMEPSIPVYGGLSISVAEGVALIGYSIEVDAQSVTIEASKSPGYIYFCQDGTWHVDDDGTPPADVSSFLYATYTSDAYDSLTVTLNNRGIEFAKIEAGVAGAVSTGIIATGIFDRDFWIEDVQIICGDPGLYDAVVVDFHVGDAGNVPATVFGTQASRPSITAGANPYTTDTSGTPDTNRTVTAGQVWAIEVDQVGTGTTDLGVLVRGRYCDAVL